MGFGSETVITVGSSAYNLAGEPENRGNFLKNNLVGSIMSGQAKKVGLGNSIFTAHRYGPRTDLISYARWANQSGYADVVGFPRGFTYQSSKVDATSFAMLKAPEPGKTNDFLYGHVDVVNYQHFAYWYIGEYVPTRIGEPFTIQPETTTVAPTLNPETVLTGRLILKFTDTGETITFTPPVDITVSGSIYAYHFYLSRVAESADITDSGWITSPDESSLPPVSGYTLDALASSETPNLFTLTKTVTTHISYSDSTPSSETISTTSSQHEKVNYLKVYKKIEIFPSTTGTPGSYEHKWEIHHRRLWKKSSLAPVINTTEEEISPGVIKTTTVTTVDETLGEFFDYKNIESLVLIRDWGNERVLIYRKGDDPSVDAYIFDDDDDDAQAVGRYLPIIPLRLHNRPVNKNNYPAQYALSRKAARRAFKKASSIDTLLKSLESNEQVSEIDHAWVVFGCSLGSKELDALNYNYQFMRDWVVGTPVDPTKIRDPFVYADAMQTYWTELEAYENFSSDSGGGSTTRPAKPTLPVIATYRFQTYPINASGDTRIADTPWAYNILITASGGSVRNGTGYHSRSNNKLGACWVYKQGDITVKTRVLTNNGNSDSAYWGYVDNILPVIVFGKQLTSSTWEEYLFCDLLHKNYVYGGISALTTAEKALQEGENSSFLFPLSDLVLRNMQLIEGTQLAMASSYLVINYYNKQTIPWYATGIFQIVIVVVVIVIAIHTGYISGESLGVLGTNAEIGAILGFATGSTAGIIAGAIANALAAAIISAVITKISTVILGDKIGAIVGAVLSMVVVWGMTHNWNFNAADLMHGFTRADNLLKLTLSGADLTTKYMQASAQEIIADTQDLMEDYRNRADELSALTQQYLGSTGVDPTVIAEATRNLVESPEDFMSRTLLTGDDIADISLSLVERFPEPQMKLPYT